ISGCTNQDCAVKMGKLLNVRKIVIGNLSNFAGIFYITCSVVDVETGKITNSERIQCNSKNELPDKAEELAEILANRLTGKLPPKTRVVTSKTRGIISEIGTGAEVTINQGELDGIKKRQIYNVLDAVKYQKVGRIKIIEVQPESAKGRIIKIYQGKIEPGQIIKYAGRSRIHSLGIAGGWGISEAPTKSPSVPKIFIFNSYYGKTQGASIYYDFITDWGWGAQITDRGEDTLAHEKAYFYEEIQIAYPVSLVIKYHFGRDFFMYYPYCGFGLATALYKYDPYDLRYSVKKNTVVPVLNAGIVCFSGKPINLTFDMKYYFALEKFYSFSPSVLVPSIGLSYSW
ncbi:MAG: hypothetical protein AB1633_01815, partial [Elusimicrobiota bacterium]